MIRRYLLFTVRVTGGTGFPVSWWSIINFNVGNHRLIKFPSVSPTVDHYRRGAARRPKADRQKCAKLLAYDSQIFLRPYVTIMTALYSCGVSSQSQPSCRESRDYTLKLNLGKFTYRRRLSNPNDQEESSLFLNTLHT